MQAGLAGLLGMAGSANVQGEDQKKLDVLANDVFISLLTVQILLKLGSSTQLALPRHTHILCRHACV